MLARVRVEPSRTTDRSSAVFSSISSDALAPERAQGAVRQVRDAEAEQGALRCLEERHEIEQQTGVA